MRSSHSTFLAVVLAAFALPVAAREPVQLASNPTLSPDGKLLAFAWRGDIWMVPSEGGTASQLTSSPATDSHPVFSPGGDQLALISDRQGEDQLFVMDLPDGSPVQLTFHSEGCQAMDWLPDGQSLLIEASRDHFWRHAQRLFLIDREPHSAERLLFDAYGQEADLSPDGGKLLFTREGERWWRKGYRGSRASQIWLYDLDVTTAGGVISTGSRQIMDLGYVRMPFRGWFVLGNGEDMELNGAVPHHLVWPAPGELPAGKDRQLDRAIKVLRREVRRWQARPRPQFRKASERSAGS